MAIADDKGATVRVRVKVRMMKVLRPTRKPKSELVLRPMTELVLFTQVHLTCDRRQLARMHRRFCSQ